jgi:erythritol transport system ATP-binding protein
MSATAPTATTVEDTTASTVDASDVLLRAEQVTKHYPGTVALDAVDFNIYRGKVNALIGENGAGKSTLMKILAGVEQYTSGRLLLSEQEIAPKSPKEAEALGIGIIYQELNLFPNMSVAENIFIAHEITIGQSYIQHSEQNKQAKKLLERLEQPISPNTLVGNLRIGQQQIVEIAKALALDVNILIMDEPTSALSTSEVRVLFRMIEELKAQGVSIVYISHKLEELMEIGDYVTVLRDGKLIAEAAVPDVNLAWIVEQMVGQDKVTDYTPPEHDIGDELLRVENITLKLPDRGKGNVLDGVSFSLRKGEILGIYGLMGAGRTELFESLVGKYPEAGGDIYLDGQRIAAGNIRKRIQRGLMLIPEDRQREGLVQTMTIADNMILANLRRFVRNLIYLSNRKEKEDVQEMVRQLSIKVGNVQNSITSLSGGNQQKVVVAKALLTSPQVLLMDEPTRGIDVGAKREIFDIMSQLVKNGLGIIFVSTELKEVMAMADRILVMSKGKITAEMDRVDATEQALVEASAIGHELKSAGD